MGGGWPRPAAQLWDYCHSSMRGIPLDRIGEQMRVPILRLLLAMIVVSQARLGVAKPPGEQKPQARGSESQEGAGGTTTIYLPGDVGDLQPAINKVPAGGIIEVSAGTYPAPSGGFRINNLPKGFTIRAAPGATVVLDGGGSHDILRFINTGLSNGRPVVFEGLTFANGRS